MFLIGVDRPSAEPKEVIGGADGTETDAAADRAACAS
jgi:hypothetical protein